MSESSTGTWTLSMTVRVDGCVLVHGYNNNAPILVRGGILTVRT
jgi:hypothetical protein